MSKQAQMLGPDKSKYRIKNKFISKKEFAIVFLIFSLVCSLIFWIWINSQFSFISVLLGICIAAIAWYFPIDPNKLETQSLFGQFLRTATSNLSKTNFIISYNISDYYWARWIKNQLEQKGFAGGLQDCKGDNFKQKMRIALSKSVRVIMILSPDYFEPIYTKQKNLQAFARLTQLHENVVVVRVEECKPNEQLASISCIDFVGLNESNARDRLIDTITYQLGKPQQETTTFTSLPFPGDIPRNWNVPSLSPFFTGREREVEELHATFTENRSRGTVRPQVIIGLPGMGMTQIAIKFCHRYYRLYESVLWINISPDQKHRDDLHQISKQLNLPIDNPQDFTKNITQWLDQHDNWLLILDECGDLNAEGVKEFTSHRVRGDILLTTNSNAANSSVDALPISKWEEKQGALFLLRRSGLIKPDEFFDKAHVTDISKAKEISELVGHVPFVLNFIGAFLSNTPYPLSRFYKLYQTSRAEFTKRYGTSDDKTFAWFFSFEKLKTTKPTAAALLTLCAFFAPDSIPLKFVERASKFSAPSSFATTLPDSGSPDSSANDGLGMLRFFADNDFELLGALDELSQYCLIDRNRNADTLTTHRLIQHIIKDSMDENEQHLWAEHAVFAVGSEFPTADFENWESCQDYLQHALVCAKYIDTWGIKSPEALRLLYEVGRYLLERGQYSDAEMLLKQVVEIRDKQSVVDRELATCHFDLAVVYHSQGKYKEALEHYKRSFSIRRDDLHLDREDPDNITSLYGLARLCDDWNMPEEAERLCRSAFGNWSSLENGKILQFHNIPMALNNFGWMYFRLSNFGMAERLYDMALNASRTSQKHNHPDWLQSCANLATLYVELKNFEKAESFFGEPLISSEKVLGENHPVYANRLNNLAVFYRLQNRFDVAEKYFEKVLVIYAQNLMSDHPEIAKVKRNLAFVLNNADYRGDIRRRAKKRALADALEQEASDMEARFARENDNSNLDVRNLLL